MRLAILAFASGIVVLQGQGELPAAVTIVGLAALGGCGFLILRRAPRWRLVSLAGCALIGFCWAAALAQLRLAEQLPVAWEGRDIELSGVVAALPQRFARGERFEFDVESARSADGTAPGVPRRILLSWYHGWDEAADDDEALEDAAARAVRPGERWRFTARLKRPHGNANPHGFDYEAALLERGIRATGTLRPRAEAQRLESFVARPGYAVERLRDIIRQRFLAALPDAPYLGVLVALAICDQRAIPNEQWTVFSRTGITHLVRI